MSTENYPVIDTVGTGNRINRIMRMRGKTVREVQEYLGLRTQQSVYHWLEGRSVPSVDNLYALSELLRVPMDRLISGSRSYKKGPDGEEICWKVFIYNYEFEKRIKR